MTQSTRIAFDTCYKENEWGTLLENNWVKVGLGKSWVKTSLLSFPEADLQIQFCVNMIYQKVLPGKCGWEMEIGPGKEGSNMKQRLSEDNFGSALQDSCNGMEVQLRSWTSHESRELEHLYSSSIKHWLRLYSRVEKNINQLALSVLQVQPKSFGSLKLILWQRDTGAGNWESKHTGVHAHEDKRETQGDMGRVLTDSASGGVLW